MEKPKIKIPTREQVAKIKDQAKRISQYKEAVKTIKSGGPEHKFAKEKMLADLIANQDIAFKALMRRVKIGDTQAIKEYYDRLFGKSKETVDFNANVQFSLKALAIEREKFKKSLEAEAHIIDVLPDKEQHG